MDGRRIVFNDQDLGLLAGFLRRLRRPRTRLWSRRSDGQAEVKATSIPRRALKAQCSALQFHQAIGDGEAQSGAFDAVAGFPKAVKSFEDALLLFSWNPGPVILHFHLNLTFN